VVGKPAGRKNCRKRKAPVRGLYPSKYVAKTIKMPKVLAERESEYGVLS